MTRDETKEIAGRRGAKASSWLDPTKAGGPGIETISEDDWLRLTAQGVPERFLERFPEQDEI
jgi:hypothetical protein